MELPNSSEGMPGQENFILLTKLGDRLKREGEITKHPDGCLQYIWRLLSAHYDFYGSETGDFVIDDNMIEKQIRLGIISDNDANNTILENYLQGNFRIWTEKRGSRTVCLFSIRECEEMAPYTNDVEYSISYDYSECAYIIETVEKDTNHSLYGTIGMDPLYFAARVLPEKVSFLSSFVPSVRKKRFNSEQREAIIEKGEEISRHSQAILAAGSTEEIIAINRQHQHLNSQNSGDSTEKKQKLILKRI